MLRKLFKPIWICLALLFLLEAWLWDLFVPPIRTLIERIGWLSLKQRLALWLASLPRWLILFIFVLPDTVLLPVKIGGLWLAVQGHVIVGTTVFVIAKTCSLGATVLLFELCRDRLLELGWFRWLYDKIEAMRFWAHQQTEPIKAQIKETMDRLKRQLAPTKSHVLRLAERLREHMQRKRGQDGR